MSNESLNVGDLTENAMLDRPSSLAYAGHRFYARTSGLEVERHDVVTEDGFVLGLYRVWSEKDRIASKKPVLLQHGIFSDGIFFIVAQK